MNERLLERISQVEGMLASLRLEIVSSASVNGTPAGSANTPSIAISPNGQIAIGHDGLSIEYRGSNNCPYGKTASSKKQDFAAIIVHHNAPQHSTDWLVQYQIDGDPTRGGHFGYHFYIAPDGKIIQGAPLTKRTNNVKPSHHPKRKDFGRFANNRNVIGISCCRAGTPEFKPTPAQLISLRILTRALCQTMNIEYSNIFGHGEIQSDRHESEGKSAAVEFRAWDSTTETFFANSTDFDDDLDDGPIFDFDTHAVAQNDVYSTGYKQRPGQMPHQMFVANEDQDDQEPDAIIGPVGGQITGQASSSSSTILNYVNQGAIRNRNCTTNLENRMIEAVEAVYGAGHSINIYSGGQDELGTGNRRTGSVRHDDFGEGGRAADVHIFDNSGRQITGVDLAVLGQYWLASRFGCVGHEMRGGGIHLDEWTTPPAGGGFFWSYAYSQNLPWGQEARQKLEAGAQGIFP